MNTKLAQAKKPWHLFLVPLLILFSVALIIWSPNGLLHLRRLQTEYRKLAQENRLLEEQNYRLYQEINRMRDDLAAIEHLARQELGLVKQGELIFQFTSPPPAKQE